MPTFSTIADRRSLREERNRQAWGAAPGVRRLHRARRARRGREAGGRRGRDHTGDATEAERGCDSAGEAVGVPAHSGYGLLLVIGREATWQAAQGTRSSKPCARAERPTGDPGAVSHAICTTRGITTSAISTARLQSTSPAMAALFLGCRRSAMVPQTMDTTNGGNARPAPVNGTAESASAISPAMRLALLIPLPSS